MRQIIHEKMAKQGQKCKCIRCREIKDTIPGKVELVEREYESSDGKEYFLSFEDTKKDKLIAFLRLRIPSETFMPDLENASVIRELHTYGVQVPVNQAGKGAMQHKGFGKKLIKRAGDITHKNGLSKMAVISGVGVREYYKKQGFKLGDSYMIKNLT
jgi:elongator complex protein 3